jgi:hypothetical protein
VGLYATNNFATIAANGLPVSIYGTGVDWVAKAMSCLPLIPNGGTLLIDDSLVGPAQTVGTFPSGVVLRFTGCGGFGLVSLNVGTFTKLYGCGAKLTMLQPNSIAINMTSFSPLQSDDSFVIDGLRIDGANLAGTTGLFLGGGTGKGIVDNLTVENCQAVGIRYDGAQFVKSRAVHLLRNAVGFKCYSGVGGGGNSNDFIDWTVIENPVGAIFSDAVGNLGMGPNKWVNPTFLGSTICGMAVFGNANLSTVDWEGGAPEVNGGGAARASSLMGSPSNRLRSTRTKPAYS